MPKYNEYYYNVLSFNLSARQIKWLITPITLKKCIHTFFDYCATEISIYSISSLQCRCKIFNFRLQLIYSLGNNGNLYCGITFGIGKFYIAPICELCNKMIPRRASAVKKESNIWACWVIVVVYIFILLCNAFFIMFRRDLRFNESPQFRFNDALKAIQHAPTVSYILDDVWLSAGFEIKSKIYFCYEEEKSSNYYYAALFWLTIFKSFISSARATDWTNFYINSTELLLLIKTHASINDEQRSIKIGKWNFEMSYLWT